MNNKIIAWVLSCLFLFSCGKPEKDSADALQTVTVKPSVVHTTLHFSGIIQPLRENTIISPINGVVETMHFHFGERINEGAVILTINSAELQKQYNDSLTDYLKAKDSYNIAKAKFVGSKNLWDSGLLAKNTFISEKSTLNNAKIALIQGEQKLKEIALQANDQSLDNLTTLNIADFKDIQTVLNKKHNQVNLTAAFDGILLYPPKTENAKSERIVPGSAVKSGQVIGLIGDLSGVAIDIDIPEIDIEKISTHMKAKVTGVALGKTVLQGEVVAVNAQASEASGNSLPSFRAVIEVKQLAPAQQSQIKVGMSASVELSVEGKEQLLIPIAAVKQQNNQSVVQLKEPDGTVRSVRITTGGALTDQVAVLSGLKSGDVLVF